MSNDYWKKRCEAAEKVMACYGDWRNAQDDEDELKTKEYQEWDNALKEWQQLKSSPSPIPVQEGLNGWIELKEGNPLPDYDEYALWLHEDGNMYVDALDKDGSPAIFENDRLEAGWPECPKCTHWHRLPLLPDGSKMEHTEQPSQESDRDNSKVK